MLWIKALHLIAVIAWLAGLFYLPRIFVHYAEGRAAGEDVRRLVVMAQRLFAFMSVMAVIALLFVASAARDWRAASSHTTSPRYRRPS